MRSPYFGYGFPCPWSRLLQDCVHQARQSSSISYSSFGPHVGGCENYDPLLGTLNMKCRIIIRIQKGTTILTTTDIWSCPCCPPPHSPWSRHPPPAFSVGVVGVDPPPLLVWLGLGGMKRHELKTPVSVTVGMFLISGSSAPGNAWAAVSVANFSSLSPYNPHFHVMLHDVSCSSPFGSPLLG